MKSLLGIVLSLSILQSCQNDETNIIQNEVNNKGITFSSIIDDAQCGVCVDPLKPHEIAKAVDYFIKNPDEARVMGEEGRAAVLEKYNWSIEENKLLNFYSSILDI